MNRQPARTFHDLIVWRKAHRFVPGVYGFINCFPRTEIYGSMSQLRRAAVSIASNIAEGFEKTDRADKARFTNTAQGSAEERRYHLILSADSGYGPSPEPTRYWRK
jgi:four helix bundle protein